jgi:hypothetical protein
MLFPECGMITYLIEELERAASPDEGLRQDEHALMQKLRFVRDGLVELDLADPHSWELINQRLAARPGRMPNVMYKRDQGEA